MTRKKKKSRKRWIKTFYFLFITDTWNFSIVFQYRKELQDLVDEQLLKQILNSKNQLHDPVSNEKIGEMNELERQELFEKLVPNEKRVKVTEEKMKEMNKVEKKSCIEKMHEIRTKCGSVSVIIIYYSSPL